MEARRTQRIECGACVTKRQDELTGAPLCLAVPLAQRLLRNRSFLPSILSPGAYHLSSHTRCKLSPILGENGKAVMVTEFSNSLVEFEV